MLTKSQYLRLTGILVAKNKEKNSWSLLPAFNRLVVAILAGVFFAILGGITTGPIADASIREPLLIHLGISALLLFVVTQQMVRKERDQLGLRKLLALILARTLLVAIGIINLILVYHAFVPFQPDATWVAIFILPGLASIWTYFAYEPHRESVVSSVLQEHESDDRQIESTPQSDNVQIAASAANPSPLQTFWAHIHTGVIQAVYWSSFLITVGVGAYYYTITKAAFIDHAFNGWGSLTTLVEIVWEAAGVFIIAIVFALVLIYALMGASVALWQSFQRSSNPGYDRELTEAELGVIRQASEKMIAYLEQEKNLSGPAVAYWAFIAGFVIIMLGSSFLIGDNGWGSSFFEADRTKDLAWYIYRDEIGIAEILFVFTFIFIYFSAGMAVGVIWRDFGEYGYLSSKRQNGNLEEELAESIAADVRKRKVTDGENFDPAKSIMRRHRRDTGYAGLAAGVLLIINAGFWYLDRMSYSLISDSGITYTDYWTSKNHSASYNEIEFIEMSCRLDDEDGLIVGYSFVLNNGRSIDVVRYDTPKQFRNTLKSQLDYWTRADKLARQANATPITGMLEPWVGKPKPKFSEKACRKGLKGYFDIDTTQKIMTLLDAPDA